MFLETEVWARTPGRCGSSIYTHALTTPLGLPGTPKAPRKDEGWGLGEFPRAGWSMQTLEAFENDSIRDHRDGISILCKPQLSVSISQNWESLDHENLKASRNCACSEG